MTYRGGSHTLFHHRYHIGWAPKYRYKVLIGELRRKRGLKAALRAGPLAG